MSLPTVLIADDDALVRRALTVFLTNAGVEVVAEASGGAQAIAAARSHHPDLALVDVQMPGVDGVAATTGIVEHSPSTRVLAITTSGRSNQSCRC